MVTFNELLPNLVNSFLFKGWKARHQNSYLTHFFCQVDSKLNLKSNWEIGFYEQDSNKITVFVKEDEFSVKSEDDVFKKDKDVVEHLNIDKVKVSFDEAAKTCNEKLPELFSNEQFGDGFIILQTIKNKPLWNFSLITKSLKFANVKIDASNGDVASHETIELVQKR